MFARQISIGDNIIRIQSFRDRQVKELKKIEALNKHFELQEVNDPNMPFWRLAFSYGAHVNRAYITWAQKTLATLSEMEQQQ